MDQQEIVDYLSGFQGFWEYDESRGRVKCLATEHEMVPRLDELKKHFEGKRFARMKCNVGYLGRPAWK